MACLDQFKGPLNSINQVIFIVNKLVDAICAVVDPILTGTPNTLTGYNGAGDFSEVTPGTGLDLAASILTVDLGDFDTGDLPEGVNLYFTDERVDDRVALLIQDGTGLNWTYDDGANTLTADVNGFHKLCVTVTSTPFTVTDQDIVLVDVAAIGSDAVINLPASTDRFESDITHPVTIKHLGGTNDVVDITPDGTEEIETVAGVTSIKKGVSLEIKPDGSDWWII